MKLKEYLDKNGVKKAWFAKELGISESTLYRIIRENSCNRSFVYAIQALTKKQVKFEDWNEIL